MNIVYQTFALPKLGRTLQDYEDAYFPADEKYHQQPTVISENRFRCVISDGATDACFSKNWADLLVRYYGNLAGDQIDNDWLAKACAEWEEFIASQKLPWFAEEKVEAGAFATLVGLTLVENKTWKGTAIGDSCLFQVRSDKVICALPISDSREFDSFPYLLGTRQKNERVLPEVKFIQGEWQPGDCFFLMSDALACWFLRTVELNLTEVSIPGLLALKNQDDFFNFVDCQKRKRDDGNLANLKDDDVTLARVYIGNSLTDTRGADLRSISFPQGGAQQTVDMPDSTKAENVQPPSDARVEEPAITDVVQSTTAGKRSGNKLWLGGAVVAVLGVLAAVFCFVQNAHHDTSVSESEAQVQAKPEPKPNNEQDQIGTSSPAASIQSTKAKSVKSKVRKHHK